MVLSDSVPDDDPLVQCALPLGVINTFLCHFSTCTMSYIDRWKLYMFQFGAYMSDLFNLDISTNLHGLMRHVNHHLIHLGCIRHGSSEQNEMAHKQYKILYNTTQKHLESIAPQLLTTWVDQSVPLGNITDSDSKSEISVVSPHTPPPICNSCATASSEAISLEDQLSWLHSPRFNCAPYCTT